LNFFQKERSFLEKAAFRVQLNSCSMNLQIRLPSRPFSIKQPAMKRTGARSIWIVAVHCHFISSLEEGQLSPSISSFARHFPFRPLHCKSACRFAFYTLREQQ